MNVWPMNTVQAQLENLLSQGANEDKAVLVVYLPHAMHVAEIRKTRRYV